MPFYEMNCGCGYSGTFMFRKMYGADKEIPDKEKPYCPECSKKPLKKAGIQKFIAKTHATRPALTYSDASSAMGLESGFLSAPAPIMGGLFDDKLKELESSSSKKDKDVAAAVREAEHEGNFKRKSWFE